ncbi:MAG: hypothetical protein EOP48_06740 [Sphingobacteriales bacterium]|nr:MAG: hypothetical protein EOP48_06740 [Sphingobacteriales bacterium]
MSEEIFEDPGVYHDCLAMDGGTLSEKGVRLLFAGYVMLTPLSEPITKKMTFGFFNLTDEEYYEQAFIVVDEDFKPTRLKDNHDEQAVFIERNRGTYKIHSDGLIAISSPIDSSCTANLKSTSGMRLRLNTFSNPGKNVIAAFTSNDVASPPYGRVLNKLSFIPIADLMKKPIKLSPPYVDESSLVIGDKKYSAFYGCLGDQK